VNKINLIRLRGFCSKHNKFLTFFRFSFLLLFFTNKKILGLDCPSGRYQTANASAACLPCIPGKFTADAGKTECVDCDANTFSKEPGSSSCDNCGVGKTSKNGSAVCQACEAGTFNNEEGKSCQDCVVGQYRPSQIEIKGIMTDTELTECK